MRNHVGHSLHRMGANVCCVLSPVASGVARSRRGIGFCSCSAVVTAPPQAEGGGGALCVSRRSLFQNQKTFPGAGQQLHADDAAAAARNQSLFGGVGAQADAVGQGAMEFVPPSAAELDRLLPSVHQLQHEIPSSGAVESGVKMVDYINTNGDDDDV